jgi:hypothetical protein
VKRPAAIVLGAAALLVIVILRGVLSPGADRLPGIDSGNLYAWEVYTRSVLADGQLPFWNPYHFAGTPHLADPQTTVFYPPALLLRWLPVPAFLGWMVALHLWIAAAGALFAARAIGLGWMAAAASAIAVMLGGSVPGWVHDGHLLLIYSVAWVPWAFGLAILSVRSGRLFPDGRLVAVLVLQFLSGYLQGSLYLAAALTFYYLFSVAWPPVAEATAASTATVPRWTPIVQLGTLALLSGAAAAFLLLPAATLVSQSGRSAGLTYREALDGSWQIRDVSTLLFPFYGAVDSPPHRYLSDRLAYVGWILTAFAPFAFFRRDRLRIAIFLGLVALAACTLALGDEGGLFRLQYQLLPGLRVPGRVLFLATVSLALLGALGLEAFLAMAAERRWRLAMPAVISGIAIAAATMVVRAEPQTTPLGPGWPWLPVALAGSILAVAMAALIRWRRVALIVALAAVVVDVTALTARAVSTVPMEPAATIRQWIGPSDGGRAISLCENRVGAREFLQNREPTLDGLPGLHLRDYADWAFVAKSGDVPPLGGLYHRIGSEGDAPARRDMIDMANVTRVVACTHDASGQLAGLTVQRNDGAWPRAVWACSAEDVTRREAIAHMIRGRYEAAGQLEPRRYIKVRWAPAVDHARQVELESIHHLQDGVRLEGVTWRYLLGDASIDAVLAIMRDPEVEDTHGVDRATGAFMPTAELEDSIPDIPGGDRERMLLPGSQICGSHGTVDVTVMDRPDGRVSAHVDAPTDGFVFFSEPAYSERRATIDGRRVPALRANLTFIAVAVPAGQHDVELHYTPSRFYLGSVISSLTAAGYGFAFIKRRRGKLR